MNSDMLVRITRYFRALNRLRAIGLEKVFAHNLADAAGVSAAVVRKDFSLLEIHGQKRGGYEITDLIDRISKILGKGDPQNVIVVGCGRIGKALMHYWFVKAESGNPSSEKNWVIRATQTVPGSGAKNVYEVSSLQTDFSGFAAN